MPIKIWSRFTQSAPTTGVNIVYKDTRSITSPATFIPFPMMLYDLNYHVRYSAYNGDETIGCDVLDADKQLNGFWAKPMLDCTISFEIII